MTWSEALAYVPVAASCFAIIIAQSAATSRAFALRYHESVDADADILGLSLANAVAAISGAFVVNGSPTQTAMADRAGARSQIAHLAFAGVILLVLLFLNGPQRYMAERMKAKIKAHAVDHTPSVTAPGAVVDIIRDAIRTVTGN